MTDETSANISIECFVHDAKVSPETASLVSFLVTGVLSSVVAAIGISGNIATTLVLLMPSFRETFHRLLICLSIVDSVFIICATTTSWISILQPIELDMEGNIVAGRHIHMVFLYTRVFGNWARVTSMLVTISISIERYFGICFPLQSRVRGQRRVAVYLIPTLLFSFLFNLPKFLEITPTGDLDPDISTNPFYAKVYKQYVEISFTIIIPLLLLIALNLRIIFAVRCQALRTASTSSEKTEQHLTYLLVSIVAVFLACHSTKFFLVFYRELDVKGSTDNQDSSCVESFPGWMHIAAPISHLLLVLNSSLNFLIYCFVGSRFRQQFRRALWSCCRTREEVNSRYSRAASSMDYRSTQRRTNNLPGKRQENALLCTETSL